MRLIYLSFIYSHSYLDFSFWSEKWVQLTIFNRLAIQVWIKSLLSVCPVEFISPLTCYWLFFFKLVKHCRHSKLIQLQGTLLFWFWVAVWQESRLHILYIHKEYKIFCYSRHPNGLAAACQILSFVVLSLRFLK